MKICLTRKCRFNNFLTYKYILKESERYKFENLSQPQWDIQVSDKIQQKLRRELNS